MDRKKIIVVGANGAIAREIIPILIKNYDVYVLARSVPEFGINSMFLKFIEGDAMSGDIWDEWLPGKHAVISCFGTRAG
jgi:nucleoside-diphosphate-sugar epimerase